MPVRTEGGQRRYNLAALRPGYAHLTTLPRETLAYAPVSSCNQRADLERQKQVLELYCASPGWTFDVIADLGSRMNYHKHGLTRLLDEILNGAVWRLVLTLKDRLLRFGAELMFAVHQAKEVDVVIINQGDDTTFEKDLASDVLETITVSFARLYGKRSCKNQKLLDGAHRAVQEAQC